MVFRYPVIFFFFLVSTVFASFPADAGEPTDRVRETIDRVLVVLRDKEMKKPAKTEERRKQMRKIVGELFDFEEMAKRSLGVHWKSRTPEERKEFTALYSDLLENAYVKKIETYTDEKIVYAEETNDKEYAVVKTKIIVPKKSLEVPIDYKLIRSGSRYGVYDVVIEGVSLVNNYRSQFNKILRSGNYDELVRKLQSRRTEDMDPDKAK